MPPDLYTEILHLPPEPRPLNYYELLGLPLFEADREVIHAAVLRQTKELKRWALDPRQGRLERVQEMLNEVNRAGFDLEDPKTRADYERQLANRLGIPLPQREAAESLPPSPPAERGPGGEGATEPDSAAGLRPARSPALVAALAMGIPLAAAALFWVGFFLGRRSSSEERDLAIQRSASAAQAQAAAEARAGQLGDEVKKAQAQAASEAKARAAAERQAKNREAELEKAALAAERRATVLEGALKTREAESEKLTLPGGPANEQPKAPPIKSPATPVAQAQRGSFKVYTAWPFHAAEATRRQDETARALGVPVEQSLDLPGGVKMTFVLIPAGEFLMGEDQGGADEKPVHKVTLTKPFFLGKHEVTQEQWQALMGRNPSLFKGAKNPVECVSWDDCQGFLKTLNERLAGKKLRLPTEAEWEYACRAGSTSRFSFGDADVGLAQYAWYYDGNSNQQTHPVGQKRPNPWGLFDMHGNVFEWCWDWFAPYPAAEQTDPSGPPDGELRVLRGGGWLDGTAGCRSAYRSWSFPGNNRCLYYGFRVVFVPGP